LLSDLRARRFAVAYSFSTIVRLATMVGASLWFISVQKLGLTGIFLGRLAGDFFGWVILILFCVKGIRLSVSLRMLLPVVRYGFPLVLSGLISILLDATGRYFLNQYSSPDQVGFYGVAIKISGLFQMLITQPFGIAWGGLMFQIAKRQNARIIYSKIFVYLFLFASSGALILSFFTPTLFSIFTTNAYNPAMAVFPAILLIRAISIMEYPAAIGIYLSGHTKWFPIICFFALIINVSIDRIFVPIYGMWGAISGWITAWTIIILLMAWIGQNYYPLKYDWKILLSPIVFWGGAWVLGKVNNSLKFENVSLLVQIFFGCLIGFSVVYVFIKDIWAIGVKHSIDR
jgi:O-antigen/teichoic acid export membrane protein